LTGRLLLGAVSVISPTISSGPTPARSPRTRSIGENRLDQVELRLARAHAPDDKAREFVGTLVQRSTAFPLTPPHNTLDSDMLPQAHIAHHPDTRCPPPLGYQPERRQNLQLIFARSMWARRQPARVGTAVPIRPETMALESGPLPLSDGKRRQDVPGLIFQLPSISRQTPVC